MKKIILVEVTQIVLILKLYLKVEKISTSLKKIYLISNYNLIKDQSKKLKISTKFCRLKI